ncbi:MAG: hypothetical protein KatS3mg087_1892 [Patescibacteria group bacterium]|nr:MAG: hypothetical protein KatS3mg087_1892 [Patescibacteria group bacterium]
MWRLSSDLLAEQSIKSRLSDMPSLLDEVVRSSQTLSACLGVIQDFLKSLEFVGQIDGLKEIYDDLVRHAVKYGSVVLIIEVENGEKTISAGDIACLRFITKKDNLGRLKIDYGLYNSYRVEVISEFSNKLTLDELEDGVYVVYAAIEYDDNLYPVVPYQPVLFDAINEYVVKRRLYSEIENGFSPKVVIFKPKSVVEDEESDTLLDEAMHRLIGSTGDTIVLIEYEREDAKPSIEVVDKKALGSEYIEIKRISEENIKRFFHIPEVLFGTAIAGKLGQNNELSGAMEYMKKYVAKPYSNLISKTFNLIGVELIELGDGNNSN